MILPVSKVLVAVLGSALIIFFERAFPFILFSKREPPRILTFIEKYIPPMVMASLVIYCLKDVKFCGGAVGFIPYFAGVIITIILHLWKRNTLLSIFGGTAVYMILIRIL